MHPALSPDKRQLAFVSNRNGQHAIWTIPFDSNERNPEISNRLYEESDGLPTDLVWTADSRYLIYSVRGGEDAGICRLDSHFSTPPEALVRDNHTNIFPEIASDNTLYFSSNRDGSWHIYRLDIDTGHIVPNQNLKGYPVVPSYDGSSLYVTGLRDGGIERYDLATAKKQVLDISLQSGDWANWGVTKNNTI